MYGGRERVCIRLGKGCSWGKRWLVWTIRVIEWWRMCRDRSERLLCEWRMVLGRIVYSVPRVK
jgi:hypothetical protein